jgi:hypothetical protein
MNAWRYSATTQLKRGMPALLLNLKARIARRNETGPTSRPRREPSVHSRRQIRKCTGFVQEAELFHETAKFRMPSIADIDDEVCLGRRLLHRVSRSN